ncbi:uncharacterized [Tachysurus ichikawai]
MYAGESDNCSSSVPATENEIRVCFFCILCVPHMPLPSSVHRVGTFAAQHALSLLSARQHIRRTNLMLASSCAFT